MLKMEINEEDGNTFDRHHKLCTSLNMDKAAADEAWKSYVAMKQNYTLEGDQLHWLCCALYVACRSSQTPTVGSPPIFIEGNLVSLTRLLRQCNLNLIHFFKKCKMWIDMANLPQEFQNKFDLLERKYEVSKVIFLRYKQLFLDIFNDPVPEVYQHKSKKARNFPCSTSKLFNFCWTLYITIKGSFAAVAVDLVSSYHLLLACCDLIYSNALLAGRKDLLNPKFEGLPPGYSDPDYIPPAKANSIIDVLCKKHDGISVEAKSVQEYCWKIHVSELFDKKILRGNAETFSGLLDALYFEANFKEINKVYDKYTLSVGEFDERIFLSDEANEDIGNLDNVESATVNRQANNMDYAIRQLSTQTPLSGRRWLKNTEDKGSRNMPLSTATQSVTRLKTLIENRKPEPSDQLLEIFESCLKNPKEKIEAVLTDLGNKFTEAYKEPNDQSASSIFCEEKLTLGRRLFYKWLESLLLYEKKIKPDLNVDIMLNQSAVPHCLFTCCMEVIIHIYNSQNTFPWILNALKIESYYFYRVIEMVLIVENELSRDVVKHLNMIEEYILECTVWQSGSPLWDALKCDQNTPDVPKCEDVLLRSQIMDENQFQTIHGVTVAAGSNAHQSPGASLSERFSSPVVRDRNLRLFRLEQAYPHTNKIDPSCVVKRENDADRRLKKFGSLGIFFRKFYNLSSVRIQDLCKKLVIRDFALMQKIWTCFEYCIVNHIELMQDRHLDQILMCSVYVICKVVHTDSDPTERSFMEIMKCYRRQPQAASHVYRSVLLSKNSSGNKSQNEDHSDGVQNAPLTPNSLACSSTTHNNQERGDLIKFYNSVFVTTIQKYVKGFRSNQQQGVTVKLSPMPSGRPTPERKRDSQKHPIKIKLLDRLDSPVNVTPQTSGLLYCVNKSSAKELHAINDMINNTNGGNGVKRKLSDFEEVEKLHPSQSMDACNRRIQNVLDDRIGQGQTVLRKE